MVERLSCPNHSHILKTPVRFQLVATFKRLQISEENNSRWAAFYLSFLLRYPPSSSILEGFSPLSSPLSMGPEVAGA